VKNIVNTKEVAVNLTLAKAIECDVFKWYQQSGTCWVWGSPGAPVFSANTVPFEYAIPNCNFVTPENITAMTFSQYIEYIYTSNIEPRNRKTNTQEHTTWGYPELKRIYMNYYLLSEPKSHMLTMKKLEIFLELMEKNFQDYIFQLIPATTIFEQGSLYRNTVFHRQRFVYKEGINQGSEFQLSLPPDLRPPLKPIQVSTNINDYLSDELTPIIINSGVSHGITDKIYVVKVTANINQNNLVSGVNAFDINGEIQPSISQVTSQI